MRTKHPRPQTRTAARPSGVALESFPIRVVEDIKDAFERAAREQVHGFVILTSPLIFNERSRIADLALKTRLPAISLFNSFPNVGGLMAYGPNLASMFKRVANYVVRILSGANPGELPIERPSKFKLVINLKTAKALGLTIPEPFLVRADGLIE
jgi:putative ABC transport system substrate-binding protein